MIEKRYRTNLNDKIAALRDSVPSLRVMAGTARLGEEDEDEDLGGLAPAHKLNKATVLAKATEYIRHLEKRNKRLQDENDQLKNRLNAFEKLATMGGTMGLHSQQGPHAGGGRGGQSGGPGGGGLMSRLMVGSLAGLMVMNGLQQHQQSHDGDKQLGFIPPVSISADWMGLASTASPLVHNHHLFWMVVKPLLLFAAVIYIVSPSFFDVKDAPDNPKASNHPSSLSAAPSLASPIKDRSHAWLTAIQTVWVPRQSTTLELAALGLKFLKLCLRKLIGWEWYRFITRTTEEQELARIKAWTIATDAQLTGGDLSVNIPCLLLTLLASCSIPPTPARLMLNALHIRVLFSDIVGSGIFSNAVQAIAVRLSNYYWLEARKAQEAQEAGNNDTTTTTTTAAAAATATTITATTATIITATTATTTTMPVEQLPENLTRLLQLDPSDVLDPQIVQRARNLAHNISDSEPGMDDEGMSSVVKDVSIRSPLDGLAAWYSSLLLQGALVASLKAKSSPALNARIQSDLDTALRVAPPTSAAQIRALAAKAVLVPKGGEVFLSEAMKTLEDDWKSHERDINQKPDGGPHITVTPINSLVTATTDIRVSLRCAMALALMRNGSRDQATRLFCDLNWKQKPNKSGLGLLGFVAAWKSLNTFVGSDEKWASDAGDNVDRAAAMLRVWIGDKRIPKFGVSRADCKRIIDYCNSLQKKLAGLEEEADDGYVSGSSEVKRLDVKV